MAELRSKCSVKASLGSLGTQSLFDKLGSYAAIESCVTLFYARLTTDPDLAHFFDGVDIKKLAMKQTMFMAYAFGGVPAWEGRSLSAAHAQLVRNQGLNLTHFDKVTQHFVEVLQQLAVQQQYIDEAVLVLLGVRHLFDPDAILDNEEQELEVQRQRRASRLAAGSQAGPH
ncbi:globin-like protein [Haematococcus lacustris]